MRVELVHCTPDAEKLIVKIARVSNPKNEDNWETGPKLLRYLLEHKHISPFEMASMCLKIETERDIAAQIIRHRSFSFSEFSTRYAQTKPAQIPAFRRQDDKNRQNSFDDLPEDDEIRFRSAAGNIIGKAYGVYEAMLMQGVAKETARRILPLCTPTTLYMHSTLRSWIHYIELRSSKETQLEHREIAIECRKIFVEQFPIIGEALDWNKCQDL
jgi:thymidylate synthase (FAD)